MQKISTAGKGKKHSAETRSKISASRKGKKHSAETRAKISAIKKGKPSPLKGKPSPLKGRKRPHFSKEWCENISKGKKARNYHLNSSLLEQA